MEFIAGPIRDMITGIYGHVGSYGLAIVLFTVILRVILWPLDIKQRKEQKKMVDLQPKMKELQKKYRNNKDKLNKKTMELYRKHNVNPMAGCLPMLIQLILLFALFSALRGLVNSGVMAGETFLWIRDISKPDSFLTKMPDGSVNGYFILPILAGVSQFFTTKMMSSTTIQPEGQPKIMNYFFPLFSVYICATYNAAFALYWVASNLIQLIQQLIIRLSARQPVKEGVN
ncbi:MAG TPA: YidC/Oxa1 family membrane protein insertase [Clostridiales bacterium]|nr:YidC/Oxa1 family membrane protein insertase [Clostridiales bacterium]